MPPKKLILSAILLKGFSAVIAQTLLIRNLLVVFYGNELTFSIILCIWLIAGAIGSSLLAGLFNKTKDHLRPFCLFQALLAFWLPCAIILIRTSKTFLGVWPGEVLNIAQITLIALASLSLLALSDGALFTLGFRLIPSVAKIYLLESLGVMIGGIIFTFVLLVFLNSFQIALLVSCLNLLACSLLLLKDKNHLFKIGSGLLFLILLNLYARSGQLQEITLKEEWKDRPIAAYENSRYGNIVALKEKNQFTIFSNGLPVVSLPSPETYFTEDFVHIPLLAKPSAKKILFAGTAVGGLIREALKYPLERIVYVEMDPAFIRIIRNLADPLTTAELKDKRVDIELTDARNFIKTTREKFDAVFVNAGLPTSLSINRYYTKEFFKEVRSTLNIGGIAIFKTWGSLSYLSKETKKINASMLATLLQEFKYCGAVPGDGFNLFIASDEKINLNPAVLSANLKRLGIKTFLINPEYLSLRLQAPYREWFYDNITGPLKSASINRDLRPTGLYEGLSLYYSQFSKKIPKIFSGFEKVRPGYVALGLAFFLLIWRLFVIKNKVKLLSLDFTILSTGFFAMALQTTVLFLFQSLLGFLFAWLAILTTSFMVGASLGAFIAYKKLKELSEYNKLGWIEIFLPLSSTAALLATAYLYANGHVSFTHIKWLFSLISVVTGLLVGIEMPVIFSLSGSGPTSNASQRSAGKLYSLDLAGACLGVLLTPLVLIPSCGIIPTALILCLLKLGNGWNILSLNPQQR
jgi:spermidine synthase